MTIDTGIEWAHHTFNPWRGCEKVCPACKNCYAEKNFSNLMHSVAWGSEDQGGTRKVKADWSEVNRFARRARRREERQRVFCASLADIFEDWSGYMLTADDDILLRNKARLDTVWEGGGFVSAEQFERMNLAAEDSQYRPLRMSDVRERLFRNYIDKTIADLDWLVLTKRPRLIRRLIPPVAEGMPKRRSNLWLGTSAGTTQYAVKFLDELKAARDLSQIHFWSCEPMLQQVDVYRDDLKCLDWIIIGGESGPDARECHVEWIQRLVDEAGSLGIPTFVKQLGSNAFYQGQPLQLQHKKGGDPAEWPVEFPRLLPC